MVKMTTMMMIVMMMMMMMMMLALCSCAIINISTTKLLNGTKDSLFGYSVTLWSPSRTEKRVVIGAPRGKNSTAGNNTLPLGTIHICHPLEDQCLPHPRLPSITGEGMDVLHFGEGMRTQGMGLGETVYAYRSSSSKLIVCAPRYPVISDIQDSLQWRGACYALSTPDGDIATLLPYNNPNFYHIGRQTVNNTAAYTGYALLGFSAAIRGVDVIMGGPGAFVREGFLIKIFWKGKRSTLRLNRKTPGPASLRDTMEGWATAVDIFDGSSLSVATSVPGSRDTKGKVVFYKLLNLDEIKTLYGQDPGTWFGYSLGSGDLDGDHAAELIIGAPLAPAPGTHQPDGGKVFVYYAPLKDVPPRESPLVLEGQRAWGRFGTAIACGGDLDQDGFNDLVVGAPYADGRVYIYSGGVDGLRKDPTQILRASDFGGLRSFGFSVGGGVDMDNNGFPDIIVGAPESDRAVLFRSAPAVMMEGGVSFEPSILNMENKTCQLPEGGGNVACLHLSVALSYSSRHIRRDLRIEVEVVLDEGSGRLDFNKTLDGWYEGNKAIFNHTLSQRRNPPILKVPVYLKPQRHQLQSPATAKVTVKMDPTEFFDPPPRRSSSSSSSSFSSSWEPLPLSFQRASSTNFTAQVRLECADEATCHSKPDLVLTAAGPAEVVVGGGDVELTVDIEVKEDRAYEALLRVDVPTGVQYQRVKSTNYVPLCLLKKENDTNVLSCFFSYDVNAGETVHLTLIFSQSPMILLAQTSDLTFHLEVSSQSKDRNDTDNSAVLTIRRVTRVNLFLDGRAIPEGLTSRTNDSLSIAQVQAKDKTGVSYERLGPHLAHRYSLLNSGPTTLLGAKLVLRMPIKVYKMLLLYQVEPPKTTSSVGPLHCTHPTLNPLNFTMTNERVKKGMTTDDDDYGGDDDDDAPVSIRRQKRESGSSVLPLPSSELISSFPLPSSSSSSSPTPTSLLSSSPPSSSSPPDQSSLSPSTLISSSLPPPPPPPLAAPLPTPPPSLSSPPGAEEGIPQEDMDQKDIIIDCSKIQCQEVACNIPSLEPGEKVEVEVGRYLIMASVKLLFGRHLKKKQSSILLASSASLYTNQECVFLNDRGGGERRDPNCAKVEEQDDMNDSPGKFTARDDSGGGTTKTTQDQPRSPVERLVTDDSRVFGKVHAGETTSDDDPHSLVKRQAGGNDFSGGLQSYAVTTKASDDHQAERTSNPASTTTGYQSTTTNTSVETSNTSTTTTSDATTTAGTQITSSGDEEDPGLNEMDDGDDLETTNDHGVKQVGVVVKVVTSIAIIKESEPKKFDLFQDLGLWKFILVLLVSIVLILIVMGVCYEIGFFERKGRLTPEQRRQMRESKKRRSRNRKYEKATTASFSAGVISF